MAWSRSYDKQQLVLVSRPFLGTHAIWDCSDWPAFKLILPKELEAVSPKVEHYKTAVVEQLSVAVETEAG